MRTFLCGIVQMPFSFFLILSLSKDALPNCSIFKGDLTSSVVWVGRGQNQELKN